MFHTIIIVGNLGRDPEMRFLANGQPVTSFSVASGHKYTNAQGETVDQTIWFKVSIFGKMAEACNEYLHKGSKVLVEGRMNADKNGQPRVWTRQDGTPAATFEVTAQTVKFLSSKGEGGGRSDSVNEPGSLGAEYEAQGGKGIDDSGIPF